MSDQLERAMAREEEALAREYNEGWLTLAEYNERQRDLGRDYGDALEEEAQAAYDEVMYFG